MKSKYRPVNRFARPIVCICLLFVLLAWPTKSVAHDEWFRDLDLEPVLSEASLVLAGRVADVSSTVITAGGEGGVTLLPIQILAVGAPEGGVFPGKPSPPPGAYRGSGVYGGGPPQDRPVAR